MENNKNEEFDLDKELMPIRVKNIQLAYARKKEIEEALEKAKLQRQTKEAKVIGLAAVLTAVGIGIGIAMIPPKNPPLPQPSNEVTQMMEDNKVIIDTYYTVVDGDSLSLIADNMGISVKDIQRENNMEPEETLIIPNQKLRLSYEINTEELNNCTNRIKVNGKSLEEIAIEYGTTAETLLRLNSDSVKRTHDDNYTYNGYEINADTIIVPDFIAIRDGIKGYQR